MRWRVMGQVQAWDGRRWAPVPAGRQRNLLAIMLLHPNQVLERGWLTEMLWDGRAPGSADQLLTHYVWRLRRLPASSGDRLRTVPTGYQLDAAAGDLDYQRFGELLSEGRHAVHRGDPEAAIGTLRTALDLWHGPALADARTLPVLEEAARRLDLGHVEARETLAEALVDAGRHVEALAVLDELAAAEPYREEPWRLLMLALHGAGRRPEALLAYQRLWRIWTEQLGVEPSQRLQQVHRLLLADDPSLSSSPERSHVPRQLPTAIANFVGRTAELKELSQLVGRAASATGPVLITVISGAGGIGKTALALHWSHQVADRFPDGQLYLNLRGFDPTGSPMTPGEGVRMFLDALGVAVRRVPASLDAQAALYRSLIAGRRSLVVLDNARDPDQVRPLLPGTPGCLVLITSRNRLTGLVADGAQPITLNLLTDDEAHDLLARHLGPERVSAEPAATDRLIASCARLPLALAVLAARAAAQPSFPLAGFAADLADVHQRLDTLDTSDPTTQLRAVFSWSYRQLSPAAARLFRLLGPHPGPDISAPAAASLAGATAAETRRLLAELTHVHLLSEHTPGRYTLHDLLRAYATELASTLDDSDQRRAATDRLLDHYLHTANAAARLLNPHRSPIAPDAPRPGTKPEGLADRRQALAWFTAEHHVLLAAIDHAAAHGRDVHTWQLAWTLVNYLDRQGHWHDLAATQRAAVAAARRLADPAAEAQTQHQLARAYLRLTRFEDAHSHARHSLDLLRLMDDKLGQAHAHINLGQIREGQGRHADSLDHARQALDLFETANHREGQANALNNIGWCHALLGDHRQALTACRRALAMLEELDDGLGQAATWDSLGYAHHHLGDHIQALACYRRSLDLRRDVGDRSGEAATLTRLGDTFAAADRPEDARAAWQQALVLLHDLDHPRAGQVRAKLAALSEPAP